MMGQDLLDRMELINAELQLQPGEVDVTRGLVALNVAQDHFEAQIAVHPEAGVDSATTAIANSGIEFTDYPSGLLRIDRMWLLSATGAPVRRIYPVNQAGEHAQNQGWPQSLFFSTAPGSPQEYEADGTKIWWSPTPNAAYTVRIYGFNTAGNITASGTFAYPDIVAFPVATFAAKLLTLGVADDSQALASLVGEVFAPVIEALANFNRDGASGFDYTRFHTT